MRKNSDEYVYHLILHYQIVLALLHRIFNLAGIDWVPLCFFFFVCLFFLMRSYSFSYGTTVLMVQMMIFSLKALGIMKCKPQFDFVNMAKKKCEDF